MWLARVVALLWIALSLACTPPAPPAVAQHPLDPLSADEITQAVELLRAAGHIDDAARFPSIGLREPAKRDVLGWTPGQPVPRAAGAIVRLGADVYEADVDLVAQRVSRWEHRAGVESPVMIEEWAMAQEIALEDTRVTEALSARGITDVEQLFCAPFTMGYFGIPEDEGKRLLKIGCFDLSRSTNNIFMAPIEGLYVVVDLHARAVHEVSDTGAVPISEANLNFTEAAQRTLRDPMRPVVQAQPAGSNVAVDGHLVRWQPWSFHVRMDRRLGIIVSLVRYQDGDQSRSVLYQGMLSEMFVPYMDPDYGWYSRTYFDAGEYGAGLLASSLVAGIDCPATATFLDVTFNDDEGSPYELPDAICIFERAGGDPVWRHAELVNQTYEGRPAVELVARMASQIGNYDYLLDWVFKLSGEIDVMVGSTGIDALKGVESVSMDSPTAGADTTYGTLVAPNLVAVNHDHYFSFRLDLDVDGQTNSFVKYSLRPTTLPEGSPRRSLYVYDQEIPETDTQARLDRHPGPSMFAVFNPNATNAVGNRTAYEILPLSHAMMALDEREPSVKRAAFTLHDFWVTPHHPDELYAGGTYVFGSTGDDGLGAWTAQERPITDTDIVVWHTVGMHHLTRAEDIPVMNVNWKGLRLRPLNFFDRNPATDLRSAFSE